MSIPRLQNEEAAELLEIIEMETGLIHCMQTLHGNEGGDPIYTAECQR